MGDSIYMYMLSRAN